MTPSGRVVAVGVEVEAAGVEVEAAGVEVVVAGGLGVVEPAGDSTVSFAVVGGGAEVVELAGPATAQAVTTSATRAAVRALTGDRMAQTAPKPHSGDSRNHLSHRCSLPVGAPSDTRHCGTEPDWLHLDSPLPGSTIAGSNIDIAVLVSGSGSNLQALLDRQGSYRVVRVVSDRPGVKALDRAESAGVETRLVAWTGDRTSFTHQVCEAVADSPARLVVLAGFMRILGREAVERFPQRIVNIHPSLLPAFPGGNAVEQALAHGVKVTGVTVHFVDEEVDHGPIIAQVPVEVRPDDDAESLHARLQAVEHRLFPEVVEALACGSILVQGRRVEWRKT